MSLSPWRTNMRPPLLSNKITKMVVFYGKNIEIGKSEKYSCVFTPLLRGKRKEMRRSLNPRLDG
jgi:hypothetical protein